MQLIKIEKDFCPACDRVGEFLNNEEITYTRLNIQGDNEEEAEKARGYLAEVGLFTVPVTLLVTPEGTLVDHARGMDVEKLAELVTLVK